MHELELLRLQFSGGLDSTNEILAFVAFLAFAATYLLVPALGYGDDRPAALSSSLYLLIGFAGLALIQRVAQLGIFAIFENQHNRFGQTDMGAMLIMYIFPILKLAVFLLAMIVYVSGIRALTRPRLRPEFFREPPELPDDDDPREGRRHA